MSSDLLFYILPKGGKLSVEPVDHRVQQVSKDAAMRQLNDEERVLNAEDRDAREEEKRKQKRKQKKQTDAQDEPHHEGVYIGDDGLTHFDDYA